MRTRARWISAVIQTVWGKPANAHAGTLTRTRAL